MIFDYFFIMLRFFFGLDYGIDWNERIIYFGNKYIVFSFGYDIFELINFKKYF